MAKLASVDSLLDAPCYTLPEAARYVRLPVATLRSWVLGRAYPRRDGAGFFAPLIQPPAPSGAVVFLSFSNLIEAHVLRALRQQHRVSVESVRGAVQYAGEQLGIERVLLSPELRALGGDIFIEHYGSLINLSRSGQLTLKHLFRNHLERVDWEDYPRPVRLFPFVEDGSSSRIIQIDPRMAFGKPVIAGKGVSTSVIVERFEAGESLQDLQEDYDLEATEVEAAIIYEQQAA